MKSGEGRRTAVRTADDEFVVLHGNRWDAEDSDGLLLELLWRTPMGRVLRGSVVGVTVCRMVGVAVRLVLLLLVWGNMALMSMVWVHDTVLNCIAQDGIVD